MILPPLVSSQAVFIYIRIACCADIASGVIEKPFLLPPPVPSLIPVFIQ